MPCGIVSPSGQEARPTTQKQYHMRRTRRHLPHIEIEGATYSLSFCRRRNVAVNLTDPAIAPLIIDALHFFANVRYILFDYTVMPDHVHAILKPLPEAPKGLLERDTQEHQELHCQRINQIVGRKGPLWQQETCDKIITSPAAYREAAVYIRNNPVAKGLVDSPDAWRWWGRGPGWDDGKRQGEYRGHDAADGENGDHDNGIANI